MPFLVKIWTLLLQSAAETVTDGYEELWQGAAEPEYSNTVMQVMASNNLIFVVLGVSLIIWFVLLGYLVRLERRLDRLERKQQ